MSKISIKQQKVSPQRGWRELLIHAEYRANTFLQSPFPNLFSLKLIEAGFGYCNINDQVLCLFCNLICHRWNFESYDPCQIHQKLSPICPFVKSMTCQHPWQFNEKKPTSPQHIGYLRIEKRLASFPAESLQGSLPVEKLAKAGFFHDGTNIVCFQCNGSYGECERNKPPLAEHVRCFPHCNYARNVCGEELFHKILQSTLNRTGGTLPNFRQQTSEFEEARFEEIINDCLDLPISQNLMNKGKFPLDIIRRCWEEQLKRKHTEFKCTCDLEMACAISKKLRELLQEKKLKIIIPNVQMQKFNNGRHDPSRINSKWSYEDILRSFEDDLLKCAENRRESCRTFIEDESITEKREQSFHMSWSENAPPPNVMVKNGWSKGNLSDNTAQCPHCLAQYSQWKTNDDPFLIHQHLSPFCSFVLASTPFQRHAIPKKQINEHYTNETIQTAESQPYNGLVPVKNDPNFCMANRELSFNDLPHNPRIDTSELAMYGLYKKDRRSIQCFYCDQNVSFWTYSLLSSQYIKQLHSPLSCLYLQQLNDRDSAPSRNHMSPGICIWCKSKEKRLLALPCRHLCLCESCGQFKRLCPKCDKNVELYVLTYLS